MVKLLHGASGDEDEDEDEDEEDEGDEGDEGEDEDEDGGSWITRASGPRRLLIRIALRFLSMSTTRRALKQWRQGLW
ncbi:hypothetical protein [Kitasatospora sp. NPDC058190]|uniref:hypothetical protein n=1 Tax=Kitasatospora sp. NPDC058190 TaxID=3346371 RepID=UPI0036D94047